MTIVLGKSWRRWTGAWAFVVLGATGTAGAAPPPAKADKAPSALGDKARELYEEGLRWAGERQWDKAHAAFLAAFTLTRHYQVAGNLGVVELELGRYREAAEHLAFARRGMREASDTTPQEQARVEEQLARATREIGALSLAASPAGAELLVDGQPVGTAPLVDPVYVEPGPHVVRARLEGYETAEQNVDAARGAPVDVTLELRKPVGGAPPLVDPLARWRVPVLVGGGGLAVLALGGAVVSTFVSSGKASDADAELEKLRAGGRRYPCAGGSVPAGCTTIQEWNDQSDSVGNVAIALYAVGTAALVGTTVFAVVTWPEDRSKSGSGRVQLAPQLSPDGAGLWATGSF